MWATFKKKKTCHALNQLNLNYSSFILLLHFLRVNIIKAI